MSAHTTKRRKLSASPQRDSTVTNRVDGNFHTKTSVENISAATSDKVTRRKSNGSSAELAFSSGLYKSSFFKLQMDELLTELRPNYDKQILRIQETLHKLKETIECLPDRPSRPVIEAEKELRSVHGVVVPFPEPRPAKDTKYTMAYSRPTNINVVGSFALRTGVKTAEPYTIDLAVTMPGSLFQEKDYVNYRYFHKRAYYIACLAVGIREAKDLGLQVKFALQDGDSLRPIISLEPVDAEKGGSSRSRLHVRILTAVEDTVFPAFRTLPTKNNIRQSSLAENSGHDGSETSTPFYNAALRSEAVVALYHKHLYSTAKKCDAFRDACILGKTWLRQRGFHTSFQGGGFGGFEWTTIMSLLFEGGGPNGKPVLLASYSSYQLFKGTVQFLAGRDLTKPLSFFATGVSFPAGGPILYDGKRGLNLLYKMTPASYAVLRHEASLTLKMLNESRHDNFERVFIVKVDERMLKFDRIISLPAMHQCNILKAIRHQSAIYEVLSRALGDRVKLISLSARRIKPWCIGTSPTQDRESRVLSVGLLLDSENAARVVDHGPPAEEKEAAASFRSFWGEKAELRRFKDGSILESLVWSDEPSARSIVHQILTYILRRHFKIVEEDINYIGDGFDEILRNAGDGSLSYSSPSFQMATSAFRSLEQSLQNMDEVPLTIRQLVPASPLLRYTALQAQSLPGCASEPIDIVLQFESSARWPDDLTAIQMTKVAFLIRIGDFLESSGASSLCQVGLENGSGKLLNNAFLDIVHTSGLVFRLRIHHDREQTLLERSLKEKSLGPRAKEEIGYALHAYKRTFIQAPRLTQAIRTLCTRLPLLSPTIRLVKHWFNCHLFTAHVSEELVELLTVKAFTQPHPWETPSSIMVGFLRTLYLISRWDWQKEPLMVDLGGELDENVIEVIKTRFSAWRSIDPAMNSVALFAASDIDTDGVTWTQYGMPSKVVAARISTLAKAAIKLLREKGCNLEPTGLFHTSLAPYDFIITLSPQISRDRPILAKFKNLSSRDLKGRAFKSTIVKSFIQDLQAHFNNGVLLFHGDERTNTVAGLWNPQTTKSRNWNLKMAYSTCPKSYSDSKSKQGDDVTINESAILNEISRLGQDMIESIEVQKST